MISKLCICHPSNMILWMVGNVITHQCSLLLTGVETLPTFSTSIYQIIMIFILTIFVGKYLYLSGIDLHKQTDWLQLINLLPSILELKLSGCLLNDINPSLGFVNFSLIQFLDLSKNAFHSKLPNWLFNLSDISVLDLTGNDLNGEIPEALLNLQYIKILVLEGNMLSGSIPEWSGEYEHIRTLNLASNLFSGSIPSTLGNLSSLTTLILKNNPLNGSLPESLGQLSNLENLIVGAKSLRGVLSEKNFVKLQNLKVLFLNLSPFIFQFDPYWVPPFQLDEIALGHLGPQFPSWLYTQRLLTMIHISDSTISVEEQDRFWSFVTKIQLVFLIDNFVTGDISNVVLNSTFIVVDSNNVEGGLPKLSSNVASFSAAGNFFSGPISPLLCHKTNENSNLIFLDLSRNHLSGGLTNCWMNWKSLAHVNLGDNNLTGKIPPSMGLLFNLTALDLHRNNFFGDIPFSLKKCQKLWILNLRENNFSGNIPSWLGLSLKALQLRSNQFTGHIPSRICQLSSLIILDLAHNRISGPIPTCLGNIKAMVFSGDSTVDQLDLEFYFVIDGTVYFSQDSLTLLTKGQESEYDQNLKFIRFLDISNNGLFGTIPPEIFGLTGLQSLSLSNNQLMGNIPVEIGNMKQLESLDLSRNQLWGEIPQSISTLSFLDFLNLSFNNLKGKIPSGTQLQSFSTLSYIGNPELCGAPLRDCTWEEGPNGTNPIIDNQDEGEDEIQSSWFYFGLGVGFAAGFWGLLASLFISKTWRYAYFRFLNNLIDRCYVVIVLQTKRIHRRLKHDASEASRRVA